MKLILFLLLLPSLYAALPSGCQTDGPCVTCGSVPVSKGKIVFHAYLTYGDGTSQMYLYNFGTSTLTQISQPAWNIEDPMNGHFSPDGTQITFMGKQNAKWNVFVWTLGSGSAPTNLTQNIPGGFASEDPKFSFDGLSIYFKHNMDIKQIILGTGDPPTVNAITNDGTLVEDSMPYPTPDGKGLYFTKGAGAGMGVYKLTFPNTTETCDAPGDIQTYYPTVSPQGYISYSQWISTVDHNDQNIYKKDCTSAKLVAHFNDCNSNDSDPAFGPTDFLFFSGTRNSPTYRLYVGQASSGRKWDLNILGINNIKINGQAPNILGASYTSVP